MGFGENAPSSAMQSSQEAASEGAKELSGIDLSKLDNDTSDVDQSILKEMGIESDDDGQSEKKPEASDDTETNDEIGDLYKEFGKEAPKASEASASSFLKIKHDGSEHELSQDDAVKFAQMGFDYTKKTQALAAKEEVFKKQYEEKEKALVAESSKFQDDLKLKNQFDFCMDHIKEEDPTFFEEMSAKIQTASRFYSNPVVDKAMKRVADLEGQVNNLLNGHKRNEYQSQFSDVQKNLFPKLEKLGIKIDESKIKDAWINSASDVKSAIFSVYGDQIDKAYASKVKLESVKKQASVQKKVDNIKPTEIKKPESSSNGYQSYSASTARYLGHKS